MSTKPTIPQPTIPSSQVSGATEAAATTTVSLWDRITDFVSRNRKPIIYVAAATTIVVTAGGIWYLTQSESKKKTKRAAAGKKKRPKQGGSVTSVSDEESQLDIPNGDRKTTVEDEGPKLPEIDEESLAKLSTEVGILKAPLTVKERKAYAVTFKTEGNKLYGGRKFTQAIDLYTKAIMCHADPVFYSNRAACYAGLKQYEKVIEDATAALSFNPEYVKPLRRRAAAYEELHQDAEALSDWTAICIIEEFKFNDSTNAVQRVLKRLAESKAAELVKTKDGKLPGASFVMAYLSSFRQKPWPQLPENPSEGDQALKRAFDHVDRAEFDEASDAFDEAIRLGCSQMALAHNYSGTFQFIRGDPEAAISEFNKSLEINPNQSQIYAKRASVYMEKGDPETALADFAKGNEIDPTDPDVYYHRGQVRFLMGEFAEAASDYSKSLELDKKFVYSHVQLGVAQYKLGQIKDAYVTFRKCIKNFKNSSEVYNYYGEILLDQGNYTEALEKFETAIELEKSAAAAHPERKVRHVMPLVNRSLLYLQIKKDQDAAEKGLKEALRLDPTSDIAVSTLAQVLLQVGKTQEALEYFDKSVELGRSERDLVGALSYAEATRAQLDVTTKYPHLAEKLSKMTEAAQQGAFMG